MNKCHLILLSVLALGGCASYNWRPGVPADCRTIAVPVFRNSSKITGMGTLCAREIARELQREGTFKLVEDPALELQGEVVSSSSQHASNVRMIGERHNNVSEIVTVKVSLVDHRTGQVLWNDRLFRGRTSYLAGSSDIVTQERDAAGRAAEDIAQQIVDELTNGKYSEAAK